ncbi:MAG: aldehyde dehydrogenase family protein [Candidatus Latescibacteria bacterium]|jgi:acyl-CoA reductase-like NAD-dependent aldehyde dehydrogenase|nr:aldehyde dehydrogenase family protein [Candidatus Latescibacterota bacterium]MBT5830035.1 aldehyde dehydrogenase family protein [Candidatus Latescibacterota bacterium]
MVEMPILRAGKPYTSLSVQEVAHIQTKEPLVRVSQANRGLVAKDLNGMAANKQKLEQFTVAELMAMTREAARLFVEADLSIGDQVQSPEDYVKQVSGTTGMPEVLCRANMEKIRLVSDEVEAILGGLTRGLDLSVLDAGWHEQDGRSLSYICEADALGAILPSNSPGVHSLWVPSIALKVPLVLKPGREEPWTPYRISMAFIEAGCPPEAFGFYPTDHGGAAEILMRCGRSMLFGGGSTVAPWLNDHRVEIHGPGQSKLILDEDQADHWEDYLDVMVTSITANGGRSCINASGVWVPKHGKEIAEALAERLAQMVGRPLDDPDAKIAAFTNPTFADQISKTIDIHLNTTGAEELTTALRGDRLVELDGLKFLNPTVVWCEDHTHPLANTEFLFPFASVVEVPQAELLDKIGPSLVVTALTKDEKFIDACLDSPNVERLNVGPIPTNQISWDQPHEGNLFAHLYRQRALQWSNQA